jgi:hypothetical protein
MMGLENRRFWIAVGIAAILTGTSATTPTRAAPINLTPTTGSTSSTSVLLSDLIPGGQFATDGILVGDKTMNGFTYSKLPGDDMPTPDQVNVFGLKDSSGNWGVSFHGIFQDKPGGSDSDAAIRFVVGITQQALQAGFRISDAHLSINGGVGPTNSGIFVDETFGQNINQSLHAFISTFPNGTTQLNDFTTFSTPLTTLEVKKDIFATAGATSGQPARVSIIDQSFSQIPEPAAVLLSLLGSIALLVCRRNRTARR